MGGRGKAQRLPVSLRSAPGCDGCIDYAVCPRKLADGSTGRSGMTPLFSAIRTPVSGGLPASTSPAVIPETIGKTSRSGVCCGQLDMVEGMPTMENRLPQFLLPEP
jgi:hypothetical protein